MSALEIEMPTTVYDKCPTAENWKTRQKFFFRALTRYKIWGNFRPIPKVVWCTQTNLGVGQKKKKTAVGANGQSMPPPGWLGLKF